MSDTFTEAFDLLYDSIESARCQLRSGRSTLAKAMCSGISTERIDTDEGRYLGVTASVRFLLADDMSRGELFEGKRVEVKQSGSTEWRAFRIGQRAVAAGVVVLSLEAVHE